MEELKEGSRVIISNPINWGGGISYLKNKTGTVNRVISVRRCLVVLDGELDSLEFATRELSLLTAPAA